MKIRESCTQWHYTCSRCRRAWSQSLPGGQREKPCSCPHPIEEAGFNARWDTDLITVTVHDRPTLRRVQVLSNVGEDLGCLEQHADSPHWKAIQFWNPVQATDIHPDIQPLIKAIQRSGTLRPTEVVRHLEAFQPYPPTAPLKPLWHYLKRLFTRA